jgi:hypothetical protein
MWNLKFVKTRIIWQLKKCTDKKAMEEDIISKFWSKEAEAKKKKKILQSDSRRLYEDGMKFWQEMKRKANRKTENYSMDIMIQESNNMTLQQNPATHIHGVYACVCLRGCW